MADSELTIDEAWLTTCDNDFQITAGTPRDNGMRFCCYCGGIIEEGPP